MLCEIIKYMFVMINIYFINLLKKTRFLKVFHIRKFHFFFLKNSIYENQL